MVKPSTISGQLASAYFNSTSEKFNVKDYSAAVIPGSKIFQPSPEDVTAFHRPGGYLEKFSIEEDRLIAEHSCC